jgi:peroxiredoxin
VNDTPAPAVSPVVNPLRSKVSRPFALAVCLVGIAGGLWVGWQDWREWLYAPGSAVGRQAPDFELADLSGKVVRLSDLRGSPVLLVWWGVGCGPCREEMPEIRRLADKYSARGLKVLLVHGWDEEPVEAVMAYAREEKLPATVLPHGGRVADKFGVTAYPSATLLDAEGRCVAHPDAVDPADPDRFDGMLETLLK